MMSTDSGKPGFTVEGDTLVVDDEATVRRTYAAQIERAGCVCHTAESYSEALSILDRERNIRVVVTDHGVHGDDTGAFVATIRDRRPGMIIVASSGRDCREEMAQVGVGRFLKKPWRLQELAELLTGRIERCSSCGFPLPLRLPLRGEEGESWICATCGARYRAVLDVDSPPDRRAFARRPDAD